MLLYPNPKDPLNPEAANLYHMDQAEYQKTVRGLVRKYARATPEVEEPPEEEKRPGHKASTDIEEDDLADITDPEALSDLSETSGIMFEEDLF